MQTDGYMYYVLRLVSLLGRPLQILDPVSVLSYLTLKRSSPTGGLAYGTPRKAKYLLPAGVTASAPRRAPLAVCTTGPAGKASSSQSQPQHFFATAPARSPPLSNFPFPENVYCRCKKF